MDIFLLTRRPMTISVALFVTALCFPTMCDSVNRCGGLPGVGYFALGWLGLPFFKSTPANLAWLANLALGASWGMQVLEKFHWSFRLSLAAFCLATIPLYARTITLGEDLPHQITKFQAGYYLWLGAILASVAASVYRRATTSARLDRDE